MLNMARPKTSKLVSSFLLTAWLMPAFSDDTKPPKLEKSLPVEVTADTLVSQDLKGQSTYSGHVMIVQGSTTLNGDKVVLNHPNRKFSGAVITGKPASFKRYLADQMQWVNGHAKTITYKAEDKTILLEGDAYINQEGQNSISGPKIFYNLENRTLSASGDQKQQKRIKVIFTPSDSTDNRKKIEKTDTTEGSP